MLLPRGECHHTGVSRSRARSSFGEADASAEEQAGRIMRFDSEAQPPPFRLTGERLTCPFGIAYDRALTLSVSSVNLPANLINAITPLDAQGSRAWSRLDPRHEQSGRHRVPGQSLAHPRDLSARLTR